MSEPTRLDLLRFLLRVQERDLARTRRWIADEERREAEEQRGAAARPEPPDWLLEHGINRAAAPVAVHAGACHMAGPRSKGVPVDVARRALAEGVPACTHCRPDTELGIMD
ncbi:DUF6233 domain-containing protein [Streptomyces sp. NPDC048290]|uniref:DUF6233 domain-containing protein n=1 Tax=Streptomyces sp. NPDC048290 TaxID=3155811 RepID=UPI00342118B1